MGIKRMKLRYAGTCAVCAATVAQGAEAAWDGDRRTVTCLPCLEGATAVSAGVAGASALAMAQQRRAADAARVERIKRDRPILGRIQLAIDPPKDTGKSWATGAVGEQRFGFKLDELAASNWSVLILHDRRLPRSPANIDHLAVTATGVWVIDAKRYRGKVVERVDKGGLLRTDHRLRVGGRDASKLVEGMRGQVEHVCSALAGTEFAGIPVHGALCFIEADWRWFAKPFAIDGVLVAWGKAIRERLAAPGPVDAARREALHRHLARSFARAAS